MNTRRPYQARLALTFFGILAACEPVPGQFDDLYVGDPVLAQPIAVSSAALINNTASPFVGNSETDLHPLAYRCGISICDNPSTRLGAGIESLRKIPKSDKKNIYLSFPNGHPANATTVVMVSTGMQDVVKASDPDPVTGQAKG